MSDDARPCLCKHPADHLAWSDERPLYCSICDEDLQTEQPLRVISVDQRFAKWLAGMAVVLELIRTRDMRIAGVDYEERPAGADG